MGEGRRPRAYLPANIQRRGFTAEQAAEYCGCETLDAFQSWIRRGIVPPAMPGTHRWDRKAIDAALDRRSGLVNDPDPSVDEWLAQHAR